MKSELIVIVDRSGSMGSGNYYIEAENGINHLIKQQQKEKGKCRITLTQFDNEHDTVMDRVPIKDAPRYTLNPRGSTALYDAIGFTVKRMKEALKGKKKRLVMLVIVTDGMENASQEYKSEDIKGLLDGLDWKVTYLGADQDAFLQAKQFGLAANHTVNISKSKMGETYAVASSKVSLMRSGKAQSFEYTSEERNNLA
jgi:hypothetical protein